VIRETFEGEASGRRKPRHLRIGVVLGSLLLAAPALPNSQSAAVVQVRVGKHPGYTRVVFELDEAVDYTIRPTGESREIVVDLEAGSARRVMTSRSDLVETVSIQPAEGGAVARIRVTEAPVHITEMLLSEPPRIVLDLRAERAATAAAEPSGPTGGSEEPVETAQADPAQTAADSSQEPPLIAVGGPDVSAGVVPPGDPTTGESPADQPPQVADGGEPDLDPWHEPDFLEDPAPGGELAGTDPELAGTDPGDAGADPAAGLEDPMAEPLDDPLTASTGEPGALPTPTVTSEPEGDEAPLLAMLRDPRVLLALGGALVVAVLLVGWSRSRRRDKRSGLFSTAIPHLPEDEPIVEASPEPFEDQTLPRIAPQAEPDLPDDRSLFDSTVGIEEAGVEDEEKPEVTHVDARGGMTPPGVALPTAGSGSVEELEQRLLGLERRLEEVLDAKDRLERHVAAQTEELRVQRAAIARTQRVLRNLTRPDDAPTEPALKTPQD
jgi:hypothetical protein